MSDFPGFNANETFTRVPDGLFRLLAQMDDIAEAKVTFHILWAIEHMDSAQRYLSREELAADPILSASLGGSELDRGLDAAIRRGTLLRVDRSAGGPLFVLNSPRGRVTARALESAGEQAARIPPPTPLEQPNIFRLYEQNIGPLTPLMADALRDAEKEYPAAWIAEALGEAVARNKRNWKYIAAILRRWKEEGRHERKSQREGAQNAGNYARSEFSEFFDND